MGIPEHLRYLYSLSDVSYSSWDAAAIRRGEEPKPFEPKRYEVTKVTEKFVYISKWGKSRRLSRAALENGEEVWHERLYDHLATWDTIKDEFERRLKDWQATVAKEKARTTREYALLVESGFVCSACGRQYEELTLAEVAQSDLGVIGWPIPTPYDGQWTCRDCRDKIFSEYVKPALGWD